MRYRSWIWLLAAWALQAEQGVLVVHIKDLHDHPIENVRLRAGDTSISAPTYSYGEARIRLGEQTKPGPAVSLEIVGDPRDKDLVFISPWDKWTHVPPFENKAKNFGRSPWLSEAIEPVWRTRLAFVPLLRRSTKRMRPKRQGSILARSRAKKLYQQLQSTLG
jgi:hypothetical protein